MSKAGLNNLHYAPGSRKPMKRIGRGQGSGHGGTSTRGHKGEGARAGTHFRPWFEGGQMPLVRRVPKFGFHSPFRVEYQVVNISKLELLSSSGKIKEGKITPEILFASGAVAKKDKPVKILGNGDIKASLEVTAHSFSKSAAEKIEKAGGKIIKISHSKAQ
jgi:large subunit ribosomal protein L15